MKLFVLLMLALPALPVGSSKSDTKLVQPLNPSLENKVPEIRSNRLMKRGGALLSGPVKRNQKSSQSWKIVDTNLEWQTWDGSLPNGAVSIYNEYVIHTDYVCKHGCEVGFYRPDEGPYCHYSLKEKGLSSQEFQILVNHENLEFLEWKDGSGGSVPQHSIKTCPGNMNVYVGKNKYGLGKVVPMMKAFFLPWDNTEYWYNYYQVLTFDTDVISEHISDVKYKLDQAETYKNPSKTIDKSIITNKQCHPISKTATLTKTTEVTQSWSHNVAVQVGAKHSFTGQIPMLFSATVELSRQVSYQFTKGTTHTESTTHTVSVQYNVPPNHRCTVRMVGEKNEVMVPYTARLSRTYRNGETRWASISGTYKGVQIGEVQAVVDRCVPEPHAQPCPGKQFDLQ